MQPRERIAYMHRRLGRRGAFLLAWGILFIIYGCGFWFEPLPEHNPHALVIHEFIPTQVRAAAWVLTGLIAVVSAFRRSPGHDTLGFIALLIMPAVRSASYGFSSVAAAFTVHYGDSRGYVSAVFYLVFVVSVVIVSGFHEDRGYAPPREHPRRER